MPTYGPHFPGRGRPGSIVGAWVRLHEMEEARPRAALQGRGHPAWD
jgi:hypothetical protein